MKSTDSLAAANIASPLAVLPLDIEALLRNDWDVSGHVGDCTTLYCYKGLTPC